MPEGGDGLRRAQERFEGRHERLGVTLGGGQTTHEHDLLRRRMVAGIVLAEIVGVLQDGARHPERLTRGHLAPFLAALGAFAFAVWSGATRRVRGWRAARPACGAT